jgi:hypothetical protein
MVEIEKILKLLSRTERNLTRVGPDGANDLDPSLSRPWASYEREEAVWDLRACYCSRGGTVWKSETWRHESRKHKGRRGKPPDLKLGFSSGGQI